MLLASFHIIKKYSLWLMAAWPSTSLSNAKSFFFFQSQPTYQCHCNLLLLLVRPPVTLY